MPPEILDHKLLYPTADDLKRIDIYSMSLIFWELLSRCTDAGATKKDRYYEPFEYELGSYFIPEVLNDHITNKNQRPQIKIDGKHDGLEKFATIIKQCWVGKNKKRLNLNKIKKELKKLINKTE